MDSHATKKRSRDLSPNVESLVEDPPEVQPEPGPSKRTRFETPLATSQHVVVHRVHCSRTRKHHERHLPSADYFDVPRLLVGVNQTTALRGQRPLRDLESYLEDHSNISLAIYANYSCEAYHAALKDSFKRVPMPDMDSDIISIARPYFSVLEDNGPPARADSEGIALSGGLEQAMNKLSVYHPGPLENWSAPHNLNYPYLSLYHCRALFIGTSAGTLGSGDRYHLEALHNYLDERMTAEFKEAEELFDAGLVNQRHWAKLFRPGEFVVTTQDGKPRALISTMTPLPNPAYLILHCWAWNFDGKFYRQKHDLTVLWPSRSDQIAITDLVVYPLRYAGEGFEDKLRRRGNTFWACRKRKYVSYDVPLQGLEVQIVSKNGKRDYGSC